MADDKKAMYSLDCLLEELVKDGEKPIELLPENKPQQGGALTLDTMKQAVNTITLPAASSGTYYYHIQPAGYSGYATQLLEEKAAAHELYYKTQQWDVKPGLAKNSILPYAKPPMWSGSSAKALISGLQNKVKPIGYHVCLGGGVLNKGQSDKDLDLYFLPLGSAYESDPESLLHYLQKRLGYSEPIGKPDYDEDLLPYIAKRKYEYVGRRIDVFIMGTEEDLEKIKHVKLVGKQVTLELAADHIVNGVK